MTTLFIGLTIAIPCVGLACYLIYKRIYLLGYEDAIENYQKIWHKERLLLEVELRRIKKKHCLKTHPCDSCNHGWNDALKRFNDKRPITPIIHP